MVITDSFENERRRVLRKLNKAHYLNSKIPARSSSIQLGIVALRREFTMSLANSNWENASSIINEIDKRQLDTAANYCT